MSTSRLADLRVRASAAQVVGLDVRGPVSEALGRAGIVVPPASEPGEVEGSAPTPATSRPDAKAAPRVVKPFAETPWPTRRRTPKSPEPPATLSGLTADERRVHRILLDALARENARDGISDGLSYAEKKNLGVLDLGFINGEIAEMERRRTARAAWVPALLALGAVVVPLVVLAAAVGGGAEAAIFAVLLSALAAGAVLASQAAAPRAMSSREAIYQALRELAVLADPDDVTSDALAQADAVIDRLADVDTSGATSGTTRQRLRS